MNSIIKAASSGTSPFDSIRRYDEKGNGYWLARELMKLLGYKTWQKFCDAIDRAKSTCLLNEESEASHINHLPGSVSGSGRTGDDYRLSRKACYWIAMAGDTRKPEIAQAHQYFSIKVREAEVLVPALSQELELMRSKNEYLSRLDSMSKMHGREFVMRALGDGNAIVKEEVKVTEVINLDTGNTQKFLSADQLKIEVNKRTGQKVKSHRAFTDAIRKAGRDDLLVAVTRPATSEYVTPDKLDEAIGIVYGRQRQKLIGE